MKKTLYKLTGWVLVLSIALSSCKKDFVKVNTDPINVISAPPEKLLAPALVNTLTANMIRNRNFNNELMQVTVSISDGDATVFRYEFRNTFSDYLWNSWYIQLTNFKDLYTQASKEEYKNTSYQGISLICQSWVYSMLTDTYGDIPYFKSNQARNGIVEPPFDRQKDIYLDIFKQLEEANELLAANTAIDPVSDPLYHGEVAKWRKFGNSLYLRLLLRVSGKAEVSADAIAKIKEIVDTKSAEYPIMTGNDDSAILRWTGEGPYTSPYVNNVRDQDFRAPSMASFFMDNLIMWVDPRLYNQTWGISQGSAGYAGVRSGYSPGADVERQSYFWSMSQNSRSLQTAPMTGMIMNYPELKFILAEAALKGWINGSAQSLYKEGVKEAITLWIPTWNDDLETYLNTGEQNWDESESFSEKMNKIHTQKYYTLFLEDLQQWFEYRRTGYPTLPKGEGLRNNGVMPARMVYPVYVQSANPTNYKAAVAAQGPDLISTQVWWQKP